jgi:hypothetical protein
LSIIEGILSRLHEGNSIKENADIAMQVDRSNESKKRPNFEEVTIENSSKKPRFMEPSEPSMDPSSHQFQSLKISLDRSSQNL